MQDKITAALEEAVKNGDTAGANVLVIKDGEEKAYCQSGSGDIQNNIPISRDTIFRLYSQTKPVTAAAAMLLVSQGRLDLGAWLSDYLPEYGSPKVNINGRSSPAKYPLLVGHLLNMTSGIPYPDDSTEGGKQSGAVFGEIENRLFSDDPVTTAEFAEKMSKVSLCNEPGEVFMYGASADIMGAVIEKVSGMSFRDFLMKNFFEPLEMTDTDFYVPCEKAHRLAKVYNYSENGLAEIRTNHLGLRYCRDVVPAFQSGGAGLCSTLDDYARFAQMLLCGGVYKGVRIMPEAAVRRITQGGFSEEKKAQLLQGFNWLSGYSYGNFMRICDEPEKTVLLSSKGEYGWDGWLGTFFSNEPAHGITLLFGTQQAGVGKTGPLVRKIKNIVMSELT